MLQLINKSAQKSPVWLVDPLYTIGSSDTCAVMAFGAGVNREHANIEVDGEQVHVKNLVGDTLVLVNGTPVVERSKLHHGDELIVGDTLMVICDPKSPQVNGDNSIAPVWSIVAKTSALKGRNFPVNDELVFGRAKDCDISLAVSRLSRRHAKLFTKDGRFFVQDLNSSNGTYVNDRRIYAGAMELHNGDHVCFDYLAFVVCGPAQARSIPSLAMRSSS